MALIQTIRNNSWILIIFIALGLIGFLMMDMGGGNAPQAPQGRELGTVNGEPISNVEFTTAEQMFYGGQGNTYSNKKQLWDYFVQRNLVEEEASDLGLGVGEEEVEALTFGPDYSPIIQNQFRNPSTGQMDIAGLNNFRQQLDAGQVPAEQVKNWNYFVGMATEDRMQSKIMNLVGKSVYAPTWMVEKNNAEQNDKYDIAYTVIPYSDITNVNTEISDSDIKAYINTYPDKYTRENEERIASYVYMEAVPTAEDSAAMKANLRDIRMKLDTVAKDSLITALNKGTYSTIYVEATEVDEEIRDAVTSAEPGTTFGPYQKDGQYRIAKLLDVQPLADSVRFRHIAIGANPQDRSTVTAAHAKADSLAELIRNGEESFEDLAQKVSQDPGSASKGGDMGYVSQVGFSPQINNLVFYKAEEGKVYKSFSQNAVHLVEVTDRKYLEERPGYRMATISKTIIPSKETQKRVRQQAYDFVYDNQTLEEMQKAAAASPELSLQESEPVDANGYEFGILGESQTSRNIIKWMHDSKVKPGTVSGDVFVYSDPVNYYSKYFVIPALKEVLSPGMATPDQVRSEVEPILLNERKAQSAIETYGSQSVSGIANSLSLPVDTAEAVNFFRPTIAGIGGEPDVVAAISTMEVGDSRCVGGDAGVICAKLLSKTPANPVVSVGQLRRFMNMSQQNTIPQAVLEAMKENAKIEDNRSAIF